MATATCLHEERCGEEPFYHVFSALASGGKESDDAPPTISRAQVGGKALSLMQASAAGFPVPPGLVLTVHFFQAWLDQIEQTAEWKDFLEAGSRNRNPAKQHCDALKAYCSNLKLDEKQQTHLAAAIKEAGLGATSDDDDDIGLVSVRSSSPQEDLEACSFAGEYVTTLGVTSHTLMAALLESFASMFDHQVVLYKQQHDLDLKHIPTIAIVVQRQIDSATSGVAFSINPANNCYDEIVMSAGFGLGESVVNGSITPDTFVVDRFQEPKIVSKKVSHKPSAIRLGSPRGVVVADTDDTFSSSRRLGGTHEQANPDPEASTLTDAQILQVADLVARVDDFRGHFVDIEWAFDSEDKLYLLQARPVTTYLPLYPEMITPRGQTKRLYLDFVVMTQGFDEHLSVLGLDMWKRRLDVWAKSPHTSKTRARPTTTANPRDNCLVWNIHGRQYLNLSNFMRIRHCKTLTGKIIRSVDQSVGRALDTVDVNDYIADSWPTGAKGFWRKILAVFWVMLPYVIKGLFRGDEAMNDYKQGANELMQTCQDDPCDDTDEPLGEVMDSMLEKCRTFFPSIGGLSAGVISLKKLRFMFANCQDGASDLLTSLCMDLNGNPTSAMGHLMVRIAGTCEFQDTACYEDFARKLQDGSYSAEFTAMYQELVTKYGCRGMKEVDAAVPRMYENPEGLFQTLKQIDPENNQIANVKARRNKAYEELLQLSEELGRENEFRHRAHMVQNLLGYREHPHYLLVVMLDRMRRRALNIARKFVKQNRLEHVDQIFSLTVAQVDAAQTDPGMDLLALVEENMAPIKKVQHVKNWPVLVDSRGRIIRANLRDEDLEEGTLLGEPISPGVVMGKAKVLSSPHEKPVLSGEILVTRSTEPSWTPLFINAAGVVLEVGGPVQHGAIIAREYGIPCVSGLANATSLIKDGDLVEVDGSTGTITIVESWEDATGTTSSVISESDSSDEEVQPVNLAKTAF